MEFFQSIGLDLSIEFWVVLCVIAVLFLIQLLYYLFVYLKPYTYEKKRDKSIDEGVELPPVSIVIASKNESENLIKNIPSILKQNYPDFEVIVVNMGSTDETYVALKELELKHPNLYHTFVPADAEDVNNKKLALTLGIKAAKNEIIIFTEAYCSPNSDNWIKEFVFEFLKDKDIVLGYNNLRIDNKFALSGFAKYDNLMHQTKFLSMAIKGKPFMGMGRNMAYKRSMFFEERGFSSVLSYFDGEDDLFINKIAKKRRVGVVLSGDSLSTTNIVDSFSVWRSLKSKYVNSKRYYKGSASFIFGFESVTKFLFKIATIASVIYGIIIENYAITALAVLFFILHFFISLYVINRLSKMFEKVSIGISLLWYELLLPLYSFSAKRAVKNKR